MLTLLAMMTMPGSPAHAATSSPDGDIPLKICTASIAPGDSPMARLASLKGFDCQPRSYRLGSGSYWVRLVPGQPMDGGRRNLSFIPGWQRDATLYLRNADGTTGNIALDNQALSRLTHIGAHVVVPLSDHASPPEAMLLRIEGAVNTNGLISCPTLRSPQASHRHELQETAIYCAFAGLCLALLAYNLALLMPIRQGFQFTYCLMLVSMLTYAWAHSGGWSLWFPDSDISGRIRLGYVTLGLTSALALRFFIDFSEKGTLPDWLRKLAMAQRLALLGCSALIVLAPLDAMPVLDRTYVWLFVALQALALTMTITALRRGSRAARVLLLSWTIPLLSCVTRIAYSLHLVSYSSLSDHTPLLAMSVNALLSSLAIALRVKMLTEERDEARHEERIARRLAEVDPLTGLLNRRGLLERASAGQELQRLLVIDIDHFKAINDGHGHDCGDDVLRELAQLLTRRCAARGQVARLGGEEFAVIGAARDIAPGLALAILADVRGHSFAHGLKVTVSIGVAEGLMTHAGWNPLYRRADTALYEAKAGGRNRVVDAGLLEAGIGGLGDEPQQILVG